MGLEGALDEGLAGLLKSTAGGLRERTFEGDEGPRLSRGGDACRPGEEGHGRPGGEDLRLDGRGCPNLDGGGEAPAIGPGGGGRPRLCVPSRPFAASPIASLRLVCLAPFIWAARSSSTHMAIASAERLPKMRAFTPQCFRPARQAIDAEDLPVSYNGPLRSQSTDAAGVRSAHTYQVS